MTLAEIKIAIASGANFNGTVYGKDNGKNWTTLFIYLDGKVTKIQEVAKTDSNAKKAEFEADLKSNNTPVASFGDTYTRFGMDVAVGEAE